MKNFGWWAAAIILATALNLKAQGVPTDQINGFLTDGEVDKAENALRGFLNMPDIDYHDNLYVLKNLGVLCASNPKKIAESDTLFRRVLELDPFTTLHDTYASTTILNRFKSIRDDIRKRKGGKALVPPIAVFEFQGVGFKPAERASLTDQFIGELQKLLVFHTLDRPSVSETIRRVKKTPETCVTRECQIDIARRLMVEYFAMCEVSRIDTVFTFQITFVLVENGQNSTLLRKVFTGPLAAVLEKALPELALALQENEAAWLNLSVEPTNTNLTLDGSPMSMPESRLPVNPGKHRLCGTSPGYEAECKEFVVQKKDAVTYSLVLPRVGGGQEPKPQGTVREDWDDEGRTNPDEENETGKKASKKTVWFILGGLGAITAALAVVMGVL